MEIKLFISHCTHDSSGSSIKELVSEFVSERLAELKELRMWAFGSLVCGTFG